MTLNIFEGGKRVLRVTQGAIIIASIFYCFSLPSIYPLKYDIRVPNGDWLRADEPCYTETDTLEYVEREHGGKGFSFALCFRSTDFNGKRLIPFAIDNQDMVTGDEKTSTSVRNYVRRKSSEFQIPKEDLEDFPAVFEEDKLWYQIGIMIVAVVAALLLEIVGRILGWVVRGFVNFELSK